eukprot:1136684-Pelagomonas_calceolata.AAC.3
MDGAEQPPLKIGKDEPAMNVQSKLVISHDHVAATAPAAAAPAGGAGVALVAVALSWVPWAARGTEVLTWKSNAAKRAYPRSV